MLVKKNGDFLTRDDLQKIRERLGVVSALESGDACDAPRDDPKNFLLPQERCCFCGLGRKLHE